MTFMVMMTSSPRTALTVDGHVCQAPISHAANRKSFPLTGLNDVLKKTLLHAGGQEKSRIIKDTKR